MYLRLREAKVLLSRRKHIPWQNSDHPAHGGLHALMSGGSEVFEVMDKDLIASITEFNSAMGPLNGDQRNPGDILGDLAKKGLHERESEGMSSRQYALFNPVHQSYRVQGGRLEVDELDIREAFAKADVIEHMTEQYNLKQIRGGKGGKWKAFLRLQTRSHPVIKAIRSSDGCSPYQNSEMIILTSLKGSWVLQASIEEIRGMVYMSIAMQHTCVLLQTLTLNLFIFHGTHASHCREPEDNVTLWRSAIIGAIDVRVLCVVSKQGVKIELQGLDALGVESGYCTPTSTARHLKTKQR
ncbi:hypothetical protein EV421DRAFT_1735604 [Armillaria borealis]|uniref:Uncharacterized protein n=1 Tax=Armillaria borealis TaxID=47425 RepID=A0AA39JIM2_9AGAR|nr:hypothetical protein EV421DRAFT_1735604 [Armillaria borealis]